MIDQKILRLLPLLAMLLLAMALASGLLTPRTQSVQTRLIGQQVARFDVPVLGTDAMRFSPSVWQNKIVVLNVFASWCVPCAAEHPALMKLAQGGKVLLYGLAWKDKPEKISAYLAEHGNPYQLVGVDTFGQSTIPLALTGVPETFVIDKNGKVAYHYDAALTDDMIDKLIVPLVEKLAQNNGQ